jgi:Tol biopolymer transport system component
MRRGAASGLVPANTAAFMPASAPEEPREPPAEERLGSWKAIAAYLKRDITTVQRWERREGMPIHRHVHDKRGSVYAFRSQLDAWLKDRRPPASSEPQQRLTRWAIPVAVVVLAIAGAASWLLLAPESEPPNPLARARITPLTDFEGVEQAAAISRDGSLVAFLSDRDGTLDAWVSRIGTGEFRNLTQAAAPELQNPEVRTVGFTPDGSLVTLWTRAGGPGGPISVRAAPTIGGSLRDYRARAVEMDWSSDGQRLVFHTADPGDPMFIVEPGGSAPRRIHLAPKGIHNHFQVWSPDDRHIYFVRGSPPDEMDIWRMQPDGSDLQRITSHNASVSYPAFLDNRTLVYLATADDGSGPWLHTLDVDRRVPRRLTFGVEQYTSLAVSADRRRMVATVEHSKASLWRVPITDGTAQEADASRLAVPTLGALSPRLGVDYLIYVSAKNDGHAIWKFADGHATELWSAPRTRVVGGPAIGPDGKRIAFAAEGDSGSRLYILDPDRAGARVVAESLEVRGAVAWSPDGESLTAAVSKDREPQLFRVPLDHDSPSALLEGYAINPVWSPDGKFLVYADADAGPDFALKAVRPDGARYDLPEIKLPRGARRVVFVPGRRALIALQGEMRHNNFWYIDLDSGARRQLTSFGRDFTIRDFDVSADGREIVFDRRRENSDLALIELGER